MAAPFRQRAFLRGMMAFALLLLSVGIWEFWLSGAVHAIALGTVMLGLCALARWWWSKSAAATIADPAMEQAKGDRSI